ncbi:hypothetical protein MIR68_004630 [Amoeboaphelidium protococcarum]|nr:hypothetical protein MIR68_004630 [Amoeboaphelidium protococcarum]
MRKSRLNLKAGLVIIVLLAAGSTAAQIDGVFDQDLDQSGKQDYPDIMNILPMSKGDSSDVFFMATEESQLQDSTTLNNALTCNYQAEFDSFVDLANDDTTPTEDRQSIHQRRVIQNLQNSFASGCELFPHKCAARFGWEGYDGLQKLFDFDHQSEQFLDGAQSNLEVENMLYKYLHTPYSTDAQQEEEDNSQLFSVAKYHLYKALWGLVERSNHQVLEYLHPYDGGKKLRASVNIKRHLTGHRRYDGQCLNPQRWIFSFFELGQLALPTNLNHPFRFDEMQGIVDVQKYIIQSMKKIYSPQCGLFAPFIMFAVGKTILQSLSEWVKSDNAITQSGRQFAKLTQLGKSQNIYEQVLKDLSNDLDEFYEQSNQGSRRGGTQNNQEVVHWHILRGVLFAVVHDVQMSLSVTLESAIYNMVYGSLSHGRTFGFARGFGLKPDLFNIQDQTFFKTLVSMAQAMCFAASQSYHQLLEFSWQVPVLSGLTQLQTPLYNYNWMDIAQFGHEKYDNYIFPLDYGIFPLMKKDTVTFRKLGTAAHTTFMFRAGESQFRRFSKQPGDGGEGGDNHDLVEQDDAQPLQNVQEDRNEGIEGSEDSNRLRASDSLADGDYNNPHQILTEDSVRNQEYL